MESVFAELQQDFNALVQRTHAAEADYSSWCEESRSQISALKDALSQGQLQSAATKDSLRKQVKKLRMRLSRFKPRLSQEDRTLECLVGDMVGHMSRRSVRGATKTEARCFGKVRLRSMGRATEKDIQKMKSKKKIRVKWQSFRTWYLFGVEFIAGSDGC